jgi:hypothetical protein
MHSNTITAGLLATASVLSTTIAKPIFPNAFTTLGGPAEPQLAVYWVRKRRDCVGVAWR